jgi:acetylornithine deacetylase/succinyl-diaminopimelate desuccinylase-like protein
MTKRLLIACIALLLASSTLLAQPAPADETTRSLAHDIYKQLLEINTTDSVGNTATAARAMAGRLLDAGFPAADVQVFETGPRKGNLVARMRGSGARKPILLLAHIDVVEARREDWTTDPFTLVEKDGYFYARGTGDDKAMAAIWIANLIRYRQEGFKPNRDIIVALTTDEETGDYNGVQWLLANHRDRIDAELALNEGAGGKMKNGKRILNGLQASEKMYVSFGLAAKDKGGHSSLPHGNNPIFRIADGLSRLEKYQFPVRLNEVTRSYFERTAALEEGQVAADMRAVGQPTPDQAAIARLSETPLYNAIMRTTCVATRVGGGHADNALPQTATALINCRVLPDQSADAVHDTIVSVLADPEIELTWIDKARPSPPSPLGSAIMGPIERTTSEMWPGLPVIPLMGTGATDGLYLRNAGIPTYGVSGLFEELGDDRAHGKDERMPVQSFYEGLDFLNRLVRRLAS